MLLKDKGFLEKEFAKDGIAIRWVKTVSSSNALQFLNAGSIDFGSTAGSAALVAKINGNPIKSVYVYSRPEWTALVTAKDSKISKPEDLKGKKVAMVRGTDPHIFLVRALSQSASPTRTSRRCWCSSMPTGHPADPRRRRRLGRPRPDDGAARGADGAQLFYRNAEANTWGILNAREEFLKDHPELVKRVISAYEEARKYSLANYAELKKIFIAVTKLAEEVVDKQLKERTELTHNKSARRSATRSSRPAWRCRRRA